MVTGDGRVNKGVQEILNFTNIKKVSKKEFLEKNFENPVYCNLDTKDYATLHFRHRRLCYVTAY